jgi:ketosteroid isomerase-like protein
MSSQSRVFFQAVSLVIFGAIASAVAQATQKNMPKDQATDLAAIIAMEHRDAEAAKVNDVETLVSLWTEDAVLIQPRSEPVVGLPAIRRLLEQEKQRSANVTTLKYEENWKERRIAGHDAYEWGEMSVTIRLPDGKQVNQTVYAIRVLRRENGQWKVARSIITPAAPAINHL